VCLDEVAFRLGFNLRGNRKMLEYKKNFSHKISRHVAAPIAFQHGSEYAPQHLPAPADLPRSGRDLLPRKLKL
jgi:hypothetical protein